MNAAEKRGEYCSNNINKNIKKKAQVAIFVIVAVAIVAVFLIIFLYPRIQVLVTEFTPNNYLKSCIEPSVKEGVEILAKQGGYLEPEGFIEYNGEKVKYLCYSSEFQKLCMVQQPALVGHFSKELEKYLEPKTRECIENLKQEYQRRGFEVSAGKSEASVMLIPKKISVEFLTPISVAKESTQTFEKFDVDIESEMYNLLSIATSIIDFESTYGDSETTLYMQYYPDLKIEKNQLSDGSVIYTVSNVVTKESFTFASRSLAWPPGYGLETE